MGIGSKLVWFFCFFAIVTVLWLSIKVVPDGGQAVLYDRM